MAVRDGPSNPDPRRRRLCLLSAYVAVNRHAVKLARSAVRAAAGICAGLMTNEILIGGLAQRIREYASDASDASA
ncbi:MULTISPECIES: hypothetical protein [Burkholderia]|jgi:hypothetical protein|uniref:Uncharacterized protein n=2 Tax=Burkholderia contaminans TaxID=488447 RepID=A0AAP1VB51_9BURK|nr:MULTISPECIES: hypothetical protein [Burkholderia]UTP27146.1 hypothetical protein NMB33_39870 [Burkholderia sp. FXe9]KKL41816.1 hypothetical protein WR31_07235 [Burkholderia contaminans LMG 23361]MBH9693115.1 hypothetical protein [Burkholderia contaminans]MBK1905126.1 hypothetical protein [Burkholderia contaminans]MBK1913266.1 hypothetical protein [Burkholderia contaminans]